MPHRWPSPSSCPVFVSIINAGPPPVPSPAAMYVSKTIDVDGRAVKFDMWDTSGEGEQAPLVVVSIVVCVRWSRLLVVYVAF